MLVVDVSLTLVCTEIDEQVDVATDEHYAPLAMLFVIIV